MKGKFTRDDEAAEKMNPTGSMSSFGRAERCRSLHAHVYPGTDMPASWHSSRGLLCSLAYAGNILRTVEGFPIESGRCLSRNLGIWVTSPEVTQHARVVGRIKRMNRCVVFLLSSHIGAL